MSTAVSTTTTGGAVSVQPDRVEVALQLMVDKFQAVLPIELPAERFCRVAINALQDPRVAEVAQTPEGRQSIYTECLIAATDGLLLDKREAFLNVYNTKIKLANGKEEWVKLAKYMPMYQGLTKLARNSGVIADIKCDIVKSSDIFSVDKFPPPGDCPIVHRYPADAFARGDMRGVYAVAQYKDGSWSNAEVMSNADVEKIRQMSPAKDKDAWSKHFGEMARKTALRRLTKYLPKSTDGMERLHNAASRGDNVFTIEGGSAPALPRKAMMGAKLLGPASPPAPPPAPPPPPVEAKQEPKPQQKAAAKTEKKADKAKDKGPPPADDDDMQGFDDRGGAGWQDPMTGEEEDSGI